MDGWRCRGQPPGRQAAEREERGLHGQQRGGAHRPGRRARRDTAQLGRELGRGHDGNGAAEAGAGHPRQDRVARRDDESAEGPDGEAVGDEAPVGQPPSRDGEAQKERRQGHEKVAADEEPAAIGAVGDGAAEEHEEDGGCHQRHLRDADPGRRLMEHDGDEPREDDGLHAEAREPGHDAGEVPGKGAGRLAHGWRPYHGLKRDPGDLCSLLRCNGERVIEE